MNFFEMLICILNSQHTCVCACASTHTHSQNLWISFKEKVKDFSSHEGKLCLTKTYLLSFLHCPSSQRRSQYRRGRERHTRNEENWRSECVSSQALGTLLKAQIYTDWRSLEQPMWPEDRGLGCLLVQRKTVVVTENKFPCQVGRTKAENLTSIYLFFSNL